MRQWIDYHGSLVGLPGGDGVDRRWAGGTTISIFMVGGTTLTVFIELGFMKPCGKNSHLDR